MKPLLKWVGGKRQLLKEIYNNLPLEPYGKYYEPFFGGGAVLFELEPEVANINDLNSELMNVYKTVRDNHINLIKYLDIHKKLNSSDYFYKIRSLDRDTKSYILLNDAEKAARIMYLNKTCYNGLYRVNSRGELNAPYGKYVNPNICDKESITKVHNYFKKAVIKISNSDFEIFLEDCCTDDFVYIDPPYDPISNTASFTGYQANGFGRDEQIRLRDTCKKLHEKGVKFMLSNSDTEFIREIYKGFQIIEVKARRSINSKGNLRGSVNEVLIINYANK